jgi:hypothetical protein
MVGRIGLENQCTLIGICRSLEVPEPFLGLAELVVSVRRIGLKLYHALEAINRWLNLALGQE